ncbi:MAG: DUF6272 family protein [Flavobacteriia bacterium]|jgi:ribonuclease HII
MIQNLNMLELLKNLDKEEEIENYLFVYYGKLNLDIIVSTIKMIESKMLMENFDKSIISKTKMICIEILQNIVKHQEKHESIFPYFILGTNDKSLKILTGNVVSKNDRDIIIEKLNHLINLDQNLIEKDYKLALKKNEISKEGNAGLGLIDIVYRSNRNVSYKMDMLASDLFAYNLNVLIN